MSQSHAKLAAGIALTGASLLSAAKGVWVSTLAAPTGRYRPEAHYMRGPGPKWRAKHAQIFTRAAGQR
jgi:hypothetical protein